MVTYTAHKTFINEFVLFYIFTNIYSLYRLYSFVVSFLSFLFCSTLGRKQKMRWLIRANGFMVKNADMWLCVCVFAPVVVLFSKVHLLVDCVDILPLFVCVWPRKGRVFVDGVMSAK